MTELRIWTKALFGALLLTMLAVVVSQAQGRTLTHWWTAHGAGGGISSNADYTVVGGIEYDAGVAQSPEYRLTGGFVAGLVEPPGTHIFLPNLKNNS